MPLYRQATRRFLATVLFTDIVGSTERAAGLGDRAWRDLLERHNAVVRRELKAFGGREMDTAGDGFFAVFEAPERAVRCAESIISAVSLLGIAVRAGVHTGECEVIAGKVGGMAVVIGARVAALAEGGQVLVSGSVRDLMTGSGRHFEGGHLRELKGVEDQWRVFHLVPDEIDGNSVTGRKAMMPLYTRRQRRRLVVGLAAVTVLALALGTTYVLTRSPRSVAVGENAVGVIGPGDGSRVSASVAVGQRPTAVAGGGGSVWVTNSAADSVSRIDSKQNVSFSINLEPGSSPSGVAVGAGAVWVANSGNAKVSRIYPATSRVVTTIAVRPGPTGIVVAFGSVWVTNALDASVTEIDPDTNEIVKVVPVGAGPTGIAAGAGYLWVTNQGDGTVTRFHPETYEPDSPVAVGNGPVGIAVADDAAWVANNLDGSLSRIDAETLTVTARTLAAKGGAYGVAVRNGDVWVSNEHAGTLMRVTTARNFRLADTVPVGGAPLGLAFVGENLWFTNAEGGAALHRGGVLTMVGPDLAAYDPAVLDPTVEYDPANWRLGQVMYDGLMGFRRSGGVQGAAAIVPNLASRRPTPTDGGLTYTFHLRKGVRYSTGKPVLAGDIRRGIERTIMNNWGAGYGYYGVIIGGEDCKAAADKAVAANKPLPDCDLSKGIIANDQTGTVTFRLRKPTPEFIYQLALLSASAVPQDTPTNLQPGTFLPATGPYKIGSYTPQKVATKASPAGHGRLELVRNPYFRQWSAAAQPAGYPDRIVLGTGYGEKEAVARVIDGRADLLWLNAGTEVERLRTRFSGQLHTSGGPSLQWVLLNARKPPFDDADARRAVAFALDRAAMARAFSGRVTCQLIVPDFPGYKPHCPFTVNADDTEEWTGPDVATARDLVAKSGTQGASVVVVTPNYPAPRKAMQRLVDTLKTLGYRASLRIYPAETDYVNEALLKPDRFNAGFFGWGADYPAASQYLVPVASGGRRGSINFSGYSDAGLDRQMTAALDKQAREPGGGSDAWSAIDRAVVDAAATIPFGASLNQVFVSQRVRNVLVQPGPGPLIAQMWVQ